MGQHLVRRAIVTTVALATAVGGFAPPAMARASARGSTAPIAAGGLNARAAGRAADAPAALTPLPANSTYARQLLRAVDPDAREPGRSSVVRVGSALDRGVRASVLVRAEETRPVRLNPRIAALYTQILDRAPDAGGLAHWQSRVQHGASLERVAIQLAVSSEAQERAKNDVQGYIGWAYEHLLDRPVDAAGHAYWSRRLGAGATPVTLASALVRSTERARTVVDGAYDRLLRRPADDAGRAYWVGAYHDARIGELDLIVAFLASPEARGSGCDPTDAKACLLPFPNDRFTLADPATPTGRRVAFKPEWMPANKDGKHINPTEWNRNDGYSPGQAASLRVPDLDLRVTGAAPQTNIGASLAADAPIVIIDADTGERHPYFAELDAQATNASDQLLYIRPAVNYTEGHRYVVALRQLRNAKGQPLAASSAFVQWRDHTTGGTLAVQDERPRMERIFAELNKAGVDRNDLYLAWDFTVASTANLTGRSLAIRDRALASLGGRAPQFTVTAVTPNPGPKVARRVEGTFSVPLYLTGDGSPGNAFTVGPDGLPVRNGTYTASFDCELPSTTATGARAVVYGHGLFGSRNEVRSGSQAAMVGDHQMAYCATDWIGMAKEDIGNAGALLQDLSKFKTLVDRSQQGILNTTFLGRLLTTPDGFVSNPAFQTTGGQPLVDTSNLFYDGNSQGGIIGGAYLALSPDTSAGVLGVTGMNYSTLLDRSADFDPFQAILVALYPNRVDQVLDIDLIQMLWDRGEADGYAAHLAQDFLPGSRPKRVLMDIAVGDHQVATLAAQVEARTAGIPVHRPAYAKGRTLDVEPAWGLRAISYPSSGSGLIIWDSGSPLAPLANIPPRAGHDPHEDPRNGPKVQEQKSTFLATDGTLVNVCGNDPCTVAPA